MIGGTDGMTGKVVEKDSGRDIFLLHYTVFNICSLTEQVIYFYTRKIFITRSTKKSTFFRVDSVQIAESLQLAVKSCCSIASVPT